MPATKARVVKLPRHRLRVVANSIYNLLPAAVSSKTPEHPIRIVCISDTHNTKPEIPEGDLLLHAGDLSENGTFDEIQSQLTWLSSQPHQHKVCIAGNHDLLLDPSFSQKHPTHRSANSAESPTSLDFGTVVYLENESVTLFFPHIGPSGRSLTIYGSPLTPQYLPSAFQVPRDVDVWSNAIPERTDVLLTHGPPYRHLDGPRRAGCIHLAREVARARPQLVVFGHIHVGYGSEEVVFGWVQKKLEGIVGGWDGWEAVPAMVLGLVWESVRAVLLPRRTGKVTRLVNAAVLGGEAGKFEHKPVVVDL